MKILVIGNGFDLEHGLPTRYKDFLDFIETINKIFVDDWFNKREKEYFCWISGPNGPDHKNLQKYFLKHNILNQLYNNNQMKELIQLSKDNIWIQYFVENIEYKNQWWIDFESEISNIIQCFDYMKNYCEYCKKYIKWPEEKEQEKYYKEEIVKRILVYSRLDIEPFELIGEKINEIIDILKKHLDDMIRCLEIYLLECVEKVPIEYIAPDIEKIKPHKVLSFNYSRTYEELYNIDKSMSFSNLIDEYDYIHGKADIKRNSIENNMVLGIDEYLDNGLKDKELEFIEFKKYFQRIYKKTGSEYKRWIKIIKDLDLKSEIYIFGHSLDVTDKDIIKELIECPNTETTVFYYDKDVYAQQIANMVKIIGQDELIKRVSGADPTIIFKQQQKRIEKN